MRLCTTQVLRVVLFLMIAASAYAQRGQFGIDAGETTDKFGGLAKTTSPVGDVNGEIIVIRGNQKQGSPSIVGGGEVRFPTDTGSHANEFAVYGGVIFHALNNALSIGFHAQVRKMDLPTSIVDNQFFTRKKLEVLEIPLFAKYKFGPDKHVFVEVQGAPEFRPRFRNSGSSSLLPNPEFDHGYFIRGSLGYDFGKWYAKATYQTRYFRFTPVVGNPLGLYNWRSDFATGGVGVNF